MPKKRENCLCVLNKHKYFAKRILPEIVALKVYFYELSVLRA